MIIKTIREWEHIAKSLGVFVIDRHYDMPEGYLVDGDTFFEILQRCTVKTDVDSWTDYLKFMAKYFTQE